MHQLDLGHNMPRLAKGMLMRVHLEADQRLLHTVSMSDLHLPQRSSRIIMNYLPAIWKIQKQHGDSAKVEAFELCRDDLEGRTAGWSGIWQPAGPSAFPSTSLLCGFVLGRANADLGPKDVVLQWHLGPVVAWWWSRSNLLALGHGATHTERPPWPHDTCLSAASLRMAVRQGSGLGALLWCSGFWLRLLSCYGLPRHRFEVIQFMDLPSVKAKQCHVFCRRKGPDLQLPWGKSFGPIFAHKLQEIILRLSPQGAQNGSGQGPRLRRHSFFLGGSIWVIRT